MASLMGLKAVSHRRSDEVCVGEGLVREMMAGGLISVTVSKEQRGSPVFLTSSLVTIVWATEPDTDR